MTVIREFLANDGFGFKKETMKEKQFTPAEIYEKMIAENLGFPEMAAMIDPPISQQGLRFHIKNYCHASGKPMPDGAKRGRKPAVKTFRIKE